MLVERLSLLSLFFKILNWTVNFGVCCLEIGETRLLVSLTSVDGEGWKQNHQLKIYVEVFFFFLFLEKRVGILPPTSSDIEEGRTSRFLELVLQLQPEKLWSQGTCACTHGGCLALPFSGRVGVTRGRQAGRDSARIHRSRSATEGSKWHLLAVFEKQMLNLHIIMALSFV